MAAFAVLFLPFLVPLYYFRTRNVSTAIIGPAASDSLRFAQVRTIAFVLPQFALIGWLFGVVLTNKSLICRLFQKIIERQLALLFNIYLVVH